MATFDLTLSELRQIHKVGHGLYTVVSTLNDQPRWLLEMGGINSLGELQAIHQGGCSSGSFMPAATYHTANQIMAEYGDDVLEYLDNECGNVTLDTSTESWSGFASKVLSYAVEDWVNSVVSVLDLDSIEAS